jgi:hypothetical protein
MGGVEVRAMRAGRRQLAERLLTEAYPVVVATVVVFAVLLGPTRAIESRLYLPAEVTVDCLNDDRGERLARTLAASILPHTSPFTKPGPRKPVRHQSRNVVTPPL